MEEAPGAGRRGPRSPSDQADVLGLRSLLALRDVELDLLPFSTFSSRAATSSASSGAGGLSHPKVSLAPFWQEQRSAPRDGRRPRGIAGSERARGSGVRQVPPGSASTSTRDRMLASSQTSQLAPARCIPRWTRGSQSLVAVFQVYVVPPAAQDAGRGAQGLGRDRVAAVARGDFTFRSLVPLVAGFAVASGNFAFRFLVPLVTGFAAPGARPLVGACVSLVRTRSVWMRRPAGCKRSVRIRGGGGLA